MKKIVVFLFIILCQAAFAQKKHKPTIAKGDSLFVAGNFKDAITAYDAALKDATAAKDARAWYRLGASWFNLNDPTKALAPFEKSHSLNPKQPGVRLGLARTYSLLNKVDKGVGYLDSAVINGFTNYKLFDSDPSFDNIRKDPRYNKIRDHALDLSYPCRTLPESRQFDFWIGDWDVYATQNPTLKTGFNRITKVAEGCVILENWESAGPHSGMSLNYYDPNDKKWKEKWAGSGQDIQDFFDGEYADNAMRFKYIGRNPDGTPFDGRLTFTNMEPGKKVRQHSERTDDGGKTWTTVYDFTYIRRADGANP